MRTFLSESRSQKSVFRIPPPELWLLDSGFAFSCEKTQ